MPFFQPLFCIAIALAFSPIWARIPYDDMKVKIFDREPRNFELLVSTSTMNLVEFFNRHDVFLAMIAGVSSLRFVPYINMFAYFAPVMCEMIADQSEWRKEFSEVTKEETMHEVAESEIRW